MRGREAPQTSRDGPAGKRPRERRKQTQKGIPVERGWRPGESCHRGHSPGQAAEGQCPRAPPRPPPRAPSQGPVPAGAEHGRPPAPPLLPAARCVRPVTGCGVHSPRGTALARSLASGSHELTAVPAPSSLPGAPTQTPVHPLPRLPLAPPGRTGAGAGHGPEGALLRALTARRCGRLGGHALLGGSARRCLPRAARPPPRPLPPRPPHVLPAHALAGPAPHSRSRACFRPWAPLPGRTASGVILPLTRPHPPEPDPKRPA